MMNEVPEYRRWRFPRLADRALSIAIVAGDSVELQRAKRLLTGALWIGMLVGSLYVGLMILAGALLPLAIGVAGLVSAAVALLALWVRPSTYPGVMHLISLISILVTSSITILYGGFLESGAFPIFGLIAVLGAVAIFEDARSLFWFGIYVVATIATVFWANTVEPTYVLRDSEARAVFNLVVVAMFVLGVFFYYVRQRSALLRLSDGLLRNILPDEIADRLKTSSEMIADEFESASVLFADVVGFTPMSSAMTPKELVTVLNDIFTDFDLLVAERGLEKIKTIGDAYMVASGVPIPREDHAQAICDLALAMQSSSQSRKHGENHILFRIGINSGPVMAGIIGRDKFSYDLWGDSVNIASRMESNGSPGRIQVTPQTRALAEGEFSFESAGTIDVKGKGPMEAWYLLGRRSTGQPSP